MVCIIYSLFGIFVRMIFIGILSSVSMFLFSSSLVFVRNNGIMQQFRWYLLQNSWIMLTVEQFGQEMQIEDCVLKIEDCDDD